MTKRLQQAISDGYMERRGREDRDFNAYYAHCQDTKRPFVRLERRRTHYHIEVELSSLAHVFTESLHRHALDLFLAVKPIRARANSRFGFGSIACDRIPPEHAKRIASELYALATVAPLREQVFAHELPQ